MATVPITPIRSGYDLGQATRGKFAFEFSGSQYLFIRAGGGNTPTGDFKLHAFKSIDGGTTYTEQDALNAPALTNLAGFNGNYTVALDGATVIVLDVTATAGSPPTITGLKKWTMNISVLSPVWSGPTTPSSIPTIDFMGRGTGQVNQVMIELAVKGANDYVMLYSGPTSGSGGSALGRVYVATFDGTTFGTPTIIPGQGSATYFLPQEISYAPVASKFYISYLKRSDTTLNVISWDKSSFGTNSIVTAEVNLVNQIGSFSELLVYTNTGVETLGIAGLTLVGGTTDTEQFFHAPTTTDPLVWVPQTISTANLPVDNAFYLTSRDISLILVGGRLTVFWVFTDTGTPLCDFYWSDAALPGSSWRTPAVLFHSSQEVNFYSACQVFAFLMTGGYGILGQATGSFNPDIDAEALDFLFTPSSPSTVGCSLTSFVTPAGRGRPPSGLQLVLFGGNGKTPGTAPGFGNVYTVPADPLGAPLLIADDDYGEMFPYYTTYFFVNHEQEQGLQLGSHRKMLSYFQATVSGVGNITITALMNILSNPWPIAVTRALVQQAIVDLEWPGASATAQRMAFKFASSPGASSAGGGTVTLTWTTTGTPTSATIDNGIGSVNPAGGSLTIPLPGIPTTYHLTVSNSMGTSNCQTTVTPPSNNSSFELQKVVATLKPVTHMPVRGST